MKQQAAKLSLQPANGCKPLQEQQYDLPALECYYTCLAEVPSMNPLETLPNASSMYILFRDPSQATQSYCSCAEAVTSLPELLSAHSGRTGIRLQCTPRGPPRPPPNPPPRLPPKPCCWSGNTCGFAALICADRDVSENALYTLYRGW